MSSRFEFVDMSIRTREDKVIRLSKVRSHAMKTVRRRRRLMQSQEHAPMHAEEEIQRQSSRKARNLSTDGSSLQASSSGAQAMTISPKTLLGSSRLDPFQPFPVEVIDRDARELVDHSTNYLWPGLLPRASTGCRIPLSTHLLEKIAINKMALLFGSSVHRDVLRSPVLTVNNQSGLNHKLQTIRLLKEALKHAKDEFPDEVLLVMMALCTNEVETLTENMKEHPPSPFIQPLRNAQWLNVYGRMSHVEAHVAAILHLVRLRGGLQNIKLAGLAEIISYVGYVLDESMMADIRLLHRCKIGQCLLTLGLDEETTRVIDDLCDYTAMIDSYLHGTPRTPEMAVMIDRRNAVQHDLCSLPAASELQQMRTGFPVLYEPIRLTLLIYALGVTFPLPPMKRIHQQLVYMLMAALGKLDLDEQILVSSRCVLWILVLGGIASLGMPERDWFVRKLADLVLMFPVYKTWASVAAQAQEFLWLDSAYRVNVSPNPLIYFDLGQPYAPSPSGPPIAISGMGSPPGNPRKETSTMPALSDPAPITAAVLDSKTFPKVRPDEQYLDVPLQSAYGVASDDDVSDRSLYSADNANEIRPGRLLTVSAEHRVPSTSPAPRKSWKGKAALSWTTNKGLALFMGCTLAKDSLQYLPLSDATVITFLAPTVACWACSILIHEPFTRSEQIAGVISFLGVVIIARPTSFLPQASRAKSSPPGSGIDGGFVSTNATIGAEPRGDDDVTPAQRLGAVGVALVGVLGAACAYTTIRWIGKRAHPLISVNYFAAWCTIVSTVALLALPNIGFRLPASLRQWVYLLFLGICGFITQFLLTAGLAYEKSSRATTMIYTQMLFALAFDKLVWNISPGALSIIGSSLILGSAMYVAMHNSKVKEKKNAENGLDEEVGLMTEGHSDEVNNPNEGEELLPGVQEVQLRTLRE
ncbi:MAG: hypothetical protein Q9163_006215 [Psora crenata]